MKELNYYTNKLLKNSFEKDVQYDLFSPVITDIYGMAQLIDFFNENNNINWRIHGLLIRQMSIILYEIMVATNVDLSHQSEYTFIKKLRNKVHHFRYKDFNNNRKEIDTSMGRSRDTEKPLLDIIIEFRKQDNQYIFWGTNTFSHYLDLNNRQHDVNIMQSIVRKFQEAYPLDTLNFKVRKSTKQYQYKNYPYSYIDIKKNTLIDNERLIDRIIISVDELSSVLMLIQDTILIEKYLMDGLYMLFFLCKIVSITYDEAIDNIISYLEKAKNSDCNCNHLRRIIENCNQDIVSKARRFRNNLHYSKFISVKIYNSEELYKYLLVMIDEIEKLNFELRLLLNVNPSKIKLKLYKILRWSEYTENR